MFTCWENPIETISDWNAIVRLLFSLSMWILKSPTMRIFSEFTTKVDRTSKLGYKFSVGPGGLYNVTRVTEWVVHGFGLVR